VLNEDLQSLAGVSPQVGSLGPSVRFKGTGIPGPSATTIKGMRFVISTSKAREWVRYIITIGAKGISRKKMLSVCLSPVTPYSVCKLED